MKHKGFTLLELMIVVAIIGVLLTIYITHDQSNINQTEKTKNKVNQKLIESALYTQYNETNKIPIGKTFSPDTKLEAELKQMMNPYSFSTDIEAEYTVWKQYMFQLDTEKIRPYLKTSSTDSFFYIDGSSPYYPNYLFFISSDGTLSKERLSFLDTKQTKLNMTGSWTISYRDVYEKDYIWGTNTNGQVGNGNTTNVSIPYLFQSEKEIKKVATGRFHTVILYRDGTVSAFGTNEHGMLGQGNTTIYNQITPIPVKNETGSDILRYVQDISVGYNHTIALLQDGRVISWGNNSDGELGTGNKTTSSLPKYVKDPNGTGVLMNISSIYTSVDMSIAFGKDGTIYVWGENENGQLGIPDTENLIPKTFPHFKKQDMKQINFNLYNGFAQKQDGTYISWGRNTYGEIGDNGNTDVFVPKETEVIRGKQVKKIVNGQYYAVALLEDGSLLSWGRNNYGQLGNGTFVNAKKPVSIKNEYGTSALGGIVDIWSGYHMTFALDQNGTLWSWGLNSDGSLGDGTNTNRNLPVKVLL